MKSYTVFTRCSQMSEGLVLLTLCKKILSFRERVFMKISPLVWIAGLVYAFPTFSFFLGFFFAFWWVFSIGLTFVYSPTHRNAISLKPKNISYQLKCRSTRQTSKGETSLNDTGQRHSLGGGGKFGLDFPKKKK